MCRANRLLGIFAVSVVCVQALFLAHAQAGSRQMNMAEELIAQDLKAQRVINIVRPYVQYSARTARDPFLWEFSNADDNKNKEFVVEHKAAALPGLFVQGIILSDKFPQAIINGTVVKVNDEIAGARIIEISRDGVVLVYEYKQYKLPAPGSTYRQPITAELSEGGKNE